MMGEGYSGAGDWYAMGNYGRDGYRPDYRDGVSYRGRKRDSMGRYSRADAKKDMVDKLRRMIDEAPDSGDMPADGLLLYNSRSYVSGTFPLC